ncbi:MAG TPA: hypothetical protein VM263_09505 [Acidimicrobiales bacterium]|nr:hypothetical protein [Acidimicrobiales bacterium]
MTAWVDEPDLAAPTAQSLNRALREAVGKTKDIEPFVVFSGLDVADYSWDDPAALVWPAVVKDAATAGVLRALVERVRDAVPAARAPLDAVLAVRRTDVVWYRCEQPARARLLGPGARLSLIDRLDLGRKAENVLGPMGMLVLSITGKPGRGKSHSRHLIRHLAEASRPPWQMVVIDVEEHWPEVEGRKADARQVVGLLSSRLGLSPAYPEVDTDTEAKRTARELVSAFCGRYKTSLPPARRLLIVDGLDRSSVADDVGVAVAHLASAIESGELPDTRLVVTGYQGAFPPRVVDGLEEDEAGAISEGHLVLFFNEIADHVGAPLDQATVDRLIGETLEGASLDELRLLGRRAALVAHRHFGNRP